jgi:hypothetical protein
MSAAGKRLLKVETALTPRQAIVLWLQEAHAFPVITDYARWLHTQPETAYPLERLPRQVEEATRTAMKGQARDEVDRAVRMAIRDVVFLFHLHEEANRKIIEDQRAMCLLVAFLAATSPSPATRARTKWAGERVEWAKRTADAMTEVCALRGGLTIVSERYYGGHDVLFAEVRAVLDLVIGGLETLIEIYNEEERWAAESSRVAGKKRRASTIDTKALLKAAQTGAAVDAERFANAAKVRTFRAMGEHRAANALLDRALEEVL